MNNKINLSPPKWALRFFRWYCHRDFVEDIEGDLLERFEKRNNENGIRSAKRQFSLEVIRLFRPGIIRSFEGHTQLNNYDMFKNYFKIGYRNLFKNSVHSFINISSLAIGIAACMAIYLFIENERSFDQFHSKKSQIYRLDEIQNFSGTKEQNVALSMPGMGPAMLNDFPEIVNYTRFRSRGENLFTKDETRLTVKKTFLVDSTFLEIFDFPLLVGDRKHALDEPNNILLTEETALKFYNSAEEALDNTISIDDELYKITGVLADVPETSHLQFDALISLTTITRTEPDFNNRWGSNSLNTYLLLENNVDITALESKFDDFMIRHMEDPDIVNYINLFLQPLTEVHLGSTDIEHDYNNYRKFNGKYLEVFMLVGIFILIIASVNFMNLTTARASQRWREIGVRKVVGAKKGQLFNQFILESVMLAMLAMLFALALNLFLMPFLNNLMGRHLSMMYFVDHPLSIGLILIATFGLGVLAGLYPSLYMTSFQVVKALKGNVSSGRKSILKSGLVVLQFGLASAMIVGTLVVVDQLNFMKNKDIGFDTHQMMLIKMNDQANDKFEVLKTELSKSQYVKGVTASGQRIGNNFHQWGFKVRMDTGFFNMASSNVFVDYDYLEVYGIKLKEGRSFSKKFSTDDGLAFIINESLAKELGIKKPIGTVAGHSWYPDDSLGTIIGVTEDFNFNSLHHKVNTLAMVVHSEWGYDEMSVKIAGDNIPAAIAEVKDIWEKNIIDWPFEYSFLDQHFEKLYESDRQMSAIVTVMTVLAILIACMGMFGLASLSTERKTKEVGIRKVLGASFGQIIYLLSKNFITLILIAFIIVTPITYYILDNWLMNFAFHVDINLLIFLVGGLLTLAIALITIGYHTIKASVSNPVKALKYE